MIKQLLRYMQFLMMASIVLSPVAHAQKQTDIHQEIVTQFNSYKTLSQFLNASDSESPLVKDLKRYANEEGILNQRMPVATVLNGRIYFAEKKLSLRFNQVTGEIIVKWESFKTTINTTTSFQAIREKIIGWDPSVKKFSLLDLIIKDAQAEKYQKFLDFFLPSVAGVSILIGTSGKPLAEQKFFKGVINLSERCFLIEKEFTGKLDHSVVVSSRKQTTDMIAKHCLPSSPTSKIEKKPRLEACKLLAKTSQCYDRLMTLDQKTHSDERLSGKELKGAPQQDETSPAVQNQ